MIFEFCKSLLQYFLSTTINETSDMNKLLQLTATTLLVSGTSLSQPLPAEPIVPPFVMADTAAAPSPLAGLFDNTESADNTNSQTNTASEPEKPLRFTLQHRFNGGTPVAKEMLEIPFNQFKNNPLVFLQVLKDNFSKHLKNQRKPLTIDTELEWVLPADVAQFWGQLPNVSINTRVDSNGAGNSDLVFPPYRREVPEIEGGGLIDWKGLTGRFTFTDQFDNLTAALNITGFRVEGPDNFTASLGESTFSGAFDANFETTQLALNLPTFEMREQDNPFNVQALVLDFNSNKTSEGLELGRTTFKIGHLDFSEASSTFRLDGLAMTTAGEEQQGVINYTLQTQVGRLLLPKELTMAEPLEIDFVGNIDLRSLDAEALLALQTTAQQMQKQPDNSMMGMMLLAQIIELIPKFLAKSPEIAITQLSVNTPKGNFQSNASVSLDPTKVKGLGRAALLSALQAQAEISIGKNLLKKLLFSYEYKTLLETAKENGDKRSPAQLQNQAYGTANLQIQLLLITGLLRNVGNNNYKLVAGFQNGKLIINGQQIPLPFGAP